MNQGGTGGVSKMIRGQLVESATKIRSAEKDLVCQRVRRFSAEQNGCINISKVVGLSNVTQPEAICRLKRCQGEWSCGFSARANTSFIEFEGGRFLHNHLVMKGIWRKLKGRRPAWACCNAANRSSLTLAGNSSLNRLSNRQWSN